MTRVGAATAAALGVVTGAALVDAGPALAQAGIGTLINQGNQVGQNKGRLLVEAKEIVYDNDNGKVSAVGDVELNYNGRTLQADRVVYDRNTGRVLAQGNVRLTEPAGTLLVGDRFELTDDFKNGFLESLQITQKSLYRGAPVTTRFTAPRAERIEGDTTVFERGTYTACEPCRENPERPPLWQVKAARIIHNSEERTVYYENATLEVAGLPVAYMPYFWSPDPTVKRATGFLSPAYVASTALGHGVSVPFFWAIAPNYDLTLNPTYLSRQGFLAQGEFRHRLETGSYNVRFSGIDQQDPSAFLPSPLGPRERTLRGSLESTGLFYINERWRTGWDFALLSDKYYLQNFHVGSEALATTYTGFREAISTAYLQGQGDRSFFDLRGYYIQGLSAADWQKQLPVVHPVLDYDKRFNGPSFLGGEVSVTANLTSLSREAAAFQASTAANAASVLPQFGLYQTCAVFDRSVCLVRGISGDTTRASAELTWRRTFIDDLGQSWTPFTYARVDGFLVNPDFSQTQFQNDRLRQFIGEESSAARAMPAIGLEYRYPFIGALGSWGTQAVEPIAQVIARPSETRIGKVPNEDAQSLVFDDSNLFKWDKFSGYDRVEGGVRANLGAQYTVRGPNQFYANALFGQSYQIAGVNSYATGDLVNTGLQSGLDTNPSDYVARVAVQPGPGLTFIGRGRFDQADFSMRRLEATALVTFDPLVPLTGSVTYARYEEQPLIGFDRRREGLATTAAYKITPNWSINSTLVFNLARYLDTRNAFASQYASLTAAGLDTSSLTYVKPNSLVAYQFGAAYSDECTTLSVTYASSPRELSTGTTEPIQTFLVRLDLKTLGEYGFKQSLNSTASGADGLSSK